MLYCEKGPKSFHIFSYKIQNKFLILMAKVSNVFLNFEISSSMPGLPQCLYDYNQNEILKGLVSAQDPFFASHLSQLTELFSYVL